MSLVFVQRGIGFLNQELQRHVLFCFCRTDGDGKFIGCFCHPVQIGKTTADAALQVLNLLLTKLLLFYHRTERLSFELISIYLTLLQRLRRIV